MKILLIEDNKAEAHIFKHAIEKIMDDSVSVEICETFSQGFEFLEKSISVQDAIIPVCSTIMRSAI